MTESFLIYLIVMFPVWVSFVVSNTVVARCQIGVRLPVILPAVVELLLEAAVAWIARSRISGISSATINGTAKPTCPPTMVWNCVREKTIETQFT